MKRVGISAVKIIAFLGVWALLIAAATMSAVGLGGEAWFQDIRLRFSLEISGALATFAALLFMARAVDKRGLETLGFNAARLLDLLTGTLLGAAIFAVPLALLVASGAARFAPDLGAFSATALILALTICFFNVVTQELLVRSYIFQELWAKYGAAWAIGVTTALFVALHAAPILQGGTQGLIAGANILLASVMLGLAYVRTNALWLPIGIHLGWNGLQGPILGISVTGTDIGLGGWSVFTFPGDALLTGGAFGVEGGLFGLIGPALGIVAVALSRRAAANFQAETR
jgi:membrane protease YdiL (CAAX protease family)